MGDSKKREALRARVVEEGVVGRRGVNPVPGTRGLNRPSTGVLGDSSLPSKYWPYKKYREKQCVSRVQYLFIIFH